MDLWTIGMPTPVALALVALIGYLWGCRNRAANRNDPAHSRRELKRAKSVIRELENAAQEVRAGLASHHASIVQFKDRLANIGSDPTERSFRQLCEEAERLLKPTMQLATQIASAYDTIRHQTGQLMSFTEVRTDPLTGLSNRRAFDESLKTMLAMLARYRASFSVAIFDLDHFKSVNDQGGHLEGDRVLQEVGQLLDDTVRETDVVARYGGEEFVVIMPHTDMAGATLFAERVRRLVEAKIHVSLSGGVATGEDGDSTRSLLSRADTALYSAKAAGRNRIFQHDGTHITAVTKDEDTTGAVIPKLQNSLAAGAAATTSAEQAVPEEASPEANVAEAVAEVASAASNDATQPATSQTNDCPEAVA